MKKTFIIIPLALSALTLSGCFMSGQISSSAANSSSSGNPTTQSTTGATQVTSGPSVSDSVTPYVPSSSTSVDWHEEPTDTGDFSIVNESGEASGFTVEGSTYTINTAGTYTLYGKLEGNILINVTKNDTVELDLGGVEIASSEFAPIYAKTADKLKVKAMEGTTNVITDGRPTKTVDDDSQGEGAIAAKADLNLIGSGSLTVVGSYNNGIHTSKDLKIKNQTLRVWGYQHALRGGNGIEITNTSTNIYAVAKTGDGLKSNDAGLTSKGKQKGTISITGGTTVINSYNDGIDAAYDVVIAEGVDDDTEEVTIPTLNIYTEIYAKLSKAGPGWNDQGNTNKSSTTAKGIKASNELSVSAGQIYVEAYDDGFHANAEALTDSDDVATGVTGLGNIHISGGNITVSCTDDGMHADNILDINGGTINVLTSYEGLEGHEINISGGHTKVIGTDDGINAGGEDNPTITISGGYVEVEVNPSGDTDGIDSNGTFTMTGGIVITKGPNSQNSSALDHEGTATINGGTLIVLGAIEGSTRWGGGGGPGGGPGGSGQVVIGDNMTTYSLSLHSQGAHMVTINGVDYTFTNSKAYGKTTCYSDTPVTGY